MILYKALNLTERDIRYAMSFTKTNFAAARFLGCSAITYKKYANRYIDSKTGLTLYQLHSKRGGGIKPRRKTKDEVHTLEVLEGKHPEFPPNKLKAKILQDGLMKEECIHCGFFEKRITDGSVPLLLIWKDGDFQNHIYENLELVCYNCYYLMYDDIFEKAETIDKKCKGYYDVSSDIQLAFA